MVHGAAKYPQQEFTTERLFSCLSKPQSTVGSSTRDFVYPESCRTDLNSPIFYEKSFEGENQSKMHTPMTHAGKAHLLSKSLQCQTSPYSPQEQISLNDGPSIVAFIPNKSRCVGFAKCSLRTMRISLTQFLDDTSFAGTLFQLSAQSVVEAVFPATLSDSPLIMSLHKQLPDVTFCAIARKFFHDVQGTCILQSSALVTRIDVLDKYLCLAALAALLRYIADIQHIMLSPTALHIEYRCREEYLEMSSRTIRALQLVSTACVDSSPFKPACASRKRPSLRTAFSNVSSSTYTASATRGQPVYRHVPAAQKRQLEHLSDFIDFTCTPMGKRFLLGSVVQPLANKHTIQLRQEVVLFFLNNSVPFAALSDALSGIVDLEHLLAFFISLPKKNDMRHAARKITNILCLHDAISRIRDIGSLIRQLFSKEGLVLIDALKLICCPDKITLVLEDVEQFLDSNWNNEKNIPGRVGKSGMSNIQHCFALKTGLNSILDATRHQYSEVVNRLVAEAVKLQEEYALPSLRLTHSNSRGYFLMFDASAQSHAPNDVFLQQTKNGKRIQCTTRNISNWNTQCNDLISEMLHATNRISDTIIQHIQGHLAVLHRATDALTLLDFLLALATAARSWGISFCQPQISDNHNLSLRQAFSPILWAESGGHWSNIQPNDLELNAKQSMIVVSGPNMSGKTTYLQLIGQICVLAHIGSMVPAEACITPVLDRICTRMGFDDCIEHDASSFTVEMIDVAHMLCHATNRSLVLIDEVGRSTHHNDAAAISFAIMDRILSQRTFAVYVTHQYELHALQMKHSNMRVMHFGVTMTNGKLKFSNKLTDGESNATQYGIELAEFLGFPLNVVKDARHIRRINMTTNSIKEKPKSDLETLEKIFARLDFSSFSLSGYTIETLIEAFSCIELVLRRLMVYRKDDVLKGNVIVLFRSFIGKHFSFAASLSEELINRHLHGIASHSRSDNIRSGMENEITGGLNSKSGPGKNSLSTRYSHEKLKVSPLKVEAATDVFPEAQAALPHNEKASSIWKNPEFNQFTQVNCDSPGETPLLDH
ncbi:hypothetical protein XU18_2549 [Perkinsela sp. CCAP 1560/4]|nr:hypothetical protein XU18_4131 [Perkinsela sp. CCAP 1560/4]KNH06648.1 hypothetical protein XU18_2549 [Perkinsela sp. CCAP 1560/4]|eukprot:KNH04643.1 hypothetical protein XU18_4131 [Perkinsela sp. CCAP 1560/4]